MAVGFKGINAFIVFIVHSCLNRGEINIPFLNIRLSYGKRTMTGFYYFLMMIFVSGSSMEYFAVDDLFRIAMMDSNKSLGLIFTG
jgi:archaellum biogenesis protein FlaJ (TadC family)